MKVIIVMRTERSRHNDNLYHQTCGVAVNLNQVIDIIKKSIASHENSQRLESWIHPTILSFYIDEREIGEYFNHRSQLVWTKEKGFLIEEDHELT